MKLLFIIPSITNYFTFLEELTAALIERGHEIHLATSRRHIARIEGYRREVLCTIHHIDFPRALSPIRHLNAAKQVKKLVADIRPDIINIHFSAALFTSMIGKDQSWPPTTGTIHGLGSPLIGGWRKHMVSLAEKWSLERVDEVFVLTSDDRDYLLKHANGAEVKVMEGYGIGCDLERFDRNAISEDAKSNLRNRLGISEGDCVYIFIGRQTHFKGFDKVVEAFRVVKKKFRNSKLLLLGEKDRIHPFSLNPDFKGHFSPDEGIFKLGWKENVQEYLAIADINVFPSEREGFPVNLMESLAMGVPVITVDSRGCRDVIRTGIDGIVLKDTSTESIAETMMELQRNTKKRAEMSENAYRNRDRFDRNRFIQNQFKIYERLTGMDI